MANNEQKTLLLNLVQLADKQYKEVLRRNKSGVADRGEVARYRSQLATKKASLLSLRYQKGELVRSLKELLPELNGKTVEVGKYSISKTVASVLSCSEKIRSHGNAPMQLSLIHI